MSRYIVDASVVVQELITDAQTVYAHQMFKVLQSNDELIVPEFCILECTNVLWKHVRFHNLPEAQAEGLIRDLLGLPLTIRPVTDILLEGLQIGIKYQLAVYDSIYIALAKKMVLPLITVDKKQAKAALNEGIALKAITDFNPPEPE